MTRPQPAGTLPVTDLHPSALQPRRSFDEASLTRLADSIRAEGVLQPLLVRPVEGGHEIVAGERRWRAAQLAGLTEVPVLIRELDDTQARAAALIENLQRENLNVIDEVEGKLELVALGLGTRVGEARGRLMQLLKAADGGEDADRLDLMFTGLGETWQSFAKNKLRILNWPEPLLAALREGLPRRLVELIGRAPEAHQERLLVMLRSGSSREELTAEVTRLGGAGERPQAARVAQVLGRRRWLDALPEKDQRDVEKWLARMPAALRAALDGR
nr:ParB/RepB/Spo0J family partition protein [Deinococcus sp. KSM4-11]